MWLTRLLIPIPLYRLTLYYLVVLLGAAILFAFLGILPYRPVDLAFSTLLIFGVCWTVNWIFAKAFGSTSHPESVYITALILTLIITPVAPTDFIESGFAVFASAWAVASKYMLAIGRRHIFNPAGFGVALAALALGPSVSWWIGGNFFLLPVVLAGGVLIVWKLRCFDLILAFSAATLVTVSVTAGVDGVWMSLSQAVLHSMFFFFAFVMLTEPRTVPWGRPRRIAYATIVGCLFAPEVHLGSFYFTPEIALLIGNVFTVISSPERWLRRRAVART